MATEKKTEQMKTMDAYRDAVARVRMEKTDEGYFVASDVPGRKNTVEHGPLSHKDAIALRTQNRIKVALRLLGYKQKDIDGITDVIAQREIVDHPSAHNRLYAAVRALEGNDPANGRAA